ncbi:MAG: hypothetical protein V4590_14190, partial [Bacteroidota bacterium]
EIGKAVKALYLALDKAGFFPKEVLPAGIMIIGKWKGRNMYCDLYLILLRFYIYYFTFFGSTNIRKNRKM